MTQLDCPCESYLTGAGRTCTSYTKHGANLGMNPRHQGQHFSMLWVSGKCASSSIGELITRCVLLVVNFEVPFSTLMNLSIDLVNVFYFEP